MTSPEQYPVLEPRPGTYLLLLSNPKKIVRDIGRLSTCSFPRGQYAYVGSARGPGGIAARVGRHLRDPEAGRRRHWHVDYLRENLPVTGVLIVYSRRVLEHRWARLVAAMADSEIPGFGCTDSSASSHLFYGAGLHAAISTAREFGPSAALHLLRRKSDGHYTGAGKRLT